MHASVSPLSLPPLQGHGGPRAAMALAAIALLLFGLCYSLATAALGGALFPAQAGGSVVVRDGRAVGSLLVAQPFDSPRYFRPRPSAAGYDPMAASGSNQARSNPALAQRIAAVTAETAARDGIAPSEVGAERVTQSGSGLDPHLTPAGAYAQVARVARARGLPPATVRALVATMVEPPQYGALGAARVNVLRLNLALDALGAAGADP